MILVGAPMSGKTTWIKNNFDIDKLDIISRDDILMKISKSNDFELAFKTVNQKEVDKELKSRLEKAGKSDKNVIIDMTNMGSKRRKSHLNYFGDNFYKVAVLFPILEKEEYNKRNQSRLVKEKKFIPENVLDNMLSSFQPIGYDEGFNKVIVL